ncbi:hypothetical protein IJI31_07815 [bacterium]|nr:hypothetical protein [bacterium]
MEIRKCEPSFGMVNYGKGVSEYISSLPHRHAIEFRVAAIVNKTNPINIDLSLVKKFGKTRLKAQVGVQEFVENIFRTPVCVLKKAIKRANKINEHQIQMRELTKGMNIPKL